MILGAVVVAIVLVILGLPIGLSLIVGVSLSVEIFQPEQFGSIGPEIWNSLNTSVLVAIPLLVIAGQFLIKSNLIAGFLELIQPLLGRVRGGTVISSIATGLFFAGSTGSSAGESATLATVFSDPFELRGYRRGFTGAVIAATAAIGILFPPNLGFVLVGTILSYPATKLWLAGIAPGLLGGGLIAIVGLVLGRREELHTRAIEQRLSSMSSTTLRAAAAIGLPILVVGGIYSGLLTIVETAGILCAYAGGYYILTQRPRPRELFNCVVRGGEMAGAILLIYVGAHLLTFFVVREGLTQSALAFIVSVAPSKWVVLIACNVLLLAVGILVDGLSLLLIATPLLYPIVSHFGMSPEQFAVMVLLNVEVGVIHPPLGLNLWAVSSATGVSIGELSRHILPFIGAVLLLLALVTFAPLGIFAWGSR